MKFSKIKFTQGHPVQCDIFIFVNWVGHIPVVRHLRFHKVVFQLMYYPSYKVVSMQVLSVS